MTDFHFIRPWWLLAIILVFIALYLLKKYRLSQSGWQQFLPQHLASVLLDNKNNSDQQTKGQSKSLIFPFIIGLLTVIALAGPTWEKLPQPVYQVERGSVLILDMSYSMYATDLTPNRLTHAKFKASDLLDQLNDGDVGLIAYAGDAFVISPLTEDVNNIKLLLPALSPDIMPELGSNPITALMLANDMLKNSGHLEGDIYWLTDGIDSEDIQDITDWSRKVPHRLNILGIGTQDGAPIKLSNGELFKDSSGAIIIPKLIASYLDGAASRGNGEYQTITNDLSDINALVNNSLNQQQMTDKKSKNLEQGDQWQEMGPYLVLLILPLVLGYFRRGISLGLSLVIIPLSVTLLPIQPAHASIWTDLWQTKDQQAQEKFNNQEYSDAAKQFTNSNWQGSAYYKAKDYENALSAFKQDSSANGFYNQGNTLAQLQKIDEAIEAYNKALELDPTMTDAKENKAKLEELKKQQEQQKQNGEGNKDQQDSQENSQDDQQGDSQSDQQQGEDQESMNQENQDQQSQDQQGQNQQQTDEQQGAENQDQNQTDQSEQEQKSEQEKQQEQAQQTQDQQQPSDQQAQPQSLTAQEQEKLDQELEEKHMQIMNKVTDDPYLLLRNKMQLEYQKRRQEGNRSGVTKQW